jgi:GST-like protein
MIDFYYWPTPNGWKVSIMLEECGLDYEVHPVHIGRGDQFKPEFLAISPNNRIPALVDYDAAGDAEGNGNGKELAIFESGAMLVYLAEKTGCLIPADTHGRFDVLQWVFWQVGGLGPMAGQLGHFRNYIDTRIDYAVERYSKEYNRLLGVLDRQLAGRDFICGEYSIADIASWPWIRSHERLGQPLDEFPHVQRWFDAIAARPAVERGCNLGSEWWSSSKSDDKLDEESRKRLFDQTAASVAEEAKEAANKDD